jgi:hypothetical protein
VPRLMHEPAAAAERDLDSEMKGSRRARARARSLTWPDFRKGDLSLLRK